MAVVVGFVVKLIRVGASKSTAVGVGVGAGVGVVEYLDGTGPWKSMTGIKCNYATNYFEDANYYVEKCKLTEKIYQELSKN